MSCRQKGKDMFPEKTVKEFTEVLASKEAVPGGGGASALIGAIGISLGDMVGELTVGKKKYAEVEDEIKELMAKAQELRAEFLALMDDDAEAFAPLAKAYSIPKDDPSRTNVLENALRIACSAPLNIMRACCKSLVFMKEFAKKGSRLAVSDAGCGALACKAALQAASLNIFINTKSMVDREYAAALEKEVNDMLEKYCPLADEVYEYVLGEIK